MLSVYILSYSGLSGSEEHGVTIQAPFSHGHANTDVIHHERIFYALRPAVCMLAHIYSAGRRHTLTEIHEKEVVQRSWEVARHRRTRSYSRATFDWAELDGCDETNFNRAGAGVVDMADVELGLSWKG